MRWFRANVRSGAWCALIAMALQFLLTFGHVHARVGTATSLLLGIQGRAEPPDGPRAPVKRLVDHCATCTLIQMAGAGAPSAAASLPAPVPITSVRLTFRATSEPAASPPLNFQARGPPIA